MPLDYNKAHQMAVFSRDAYLPMGKFVAKHGKYFIDFFDKGSTQCYLLTYKDQLVVCFRGTEPTKFADIKADLDFFKVHEKGWGEVHAGFFDALGEVYSQLLTRVIETRESHSIVFTGHSLGAALATLAMARFNDPNAELFTFGSPRVGNSEFARNFTKRMPNIWRIRNHNDVVTQAPKVFYYHVGDMYYIDGAGVIVQNPSWWCRFKGFCSGTVKGFGRRELDGFADHSIDRYAHRLNSYTDSKRWEGDL